MNHAPLSWLTLLLLGTLFTGCATRKLPKYEQPMARTEFQSVRTTAYTHTESDHRRYAKRSALGNTLQSGAVKSAAADWSRWPAGTVFKVLETGEVYEVDDYGWALSGTNTIDLYKPTRGSMNQWGVRRVNIRILSWGDDQRSYAVLAPRAKHRHVKRMLDQMRRHGRQRVVHERHQGNERTAVAHRSEPSPVLESFASFVDSSRVP